MALEGDYQYRKDDFTCTDKMKANFSDNGYVIIRGLFDEDEVKNALRSFEETDVIKEHGVAVDDGMGKKAKLLIWSHPGNDVSGMIGRCEKMVDTCEALLGGEVYHYHGKLLYKNARTGGAHLWHQDYGYWYNNGCLFPDMMTVFVALDKCTKSNGCLQILPGSHKCGRIEHDLSSGQKAANVQRTEEIRQALPLAYVEMQPGDALFFHCNLLHSSSANESPDRRWALLIAYNRKSNNPTVIHHHPCYTPIQKVPNSAVKECKIYDDFSGKEFYDVLVKKPSIASIANKQAVYDNEKDT